MTNQLFKFSIRSIIRQKSYLFINIAGLSIGIACSLIIALFIMHELSYDQFNEKKDRIYRLIIHGKISGEEVNYAISNGAVGPAMQRDFPEVEDFTRITPTMNDFVVKYNDKCFVESVALADSSFFNIFSIPIMLGDKQNVLTAPYTIIIAESTAKKIFGNEDPINKMLKLGNDDELYRITAVMADIPETSHFNANIIGSFATYNSTNDNNWAINSFITYFLLKPNTSVEQVNAKMPELMHKYLGPTAVEALGVSIEEFMSKNKYYYYLQPLMDIHLNQSITEYTKPASNPKYLYIFGSIALLLIIIASVNYMNLATAQASKRAKEVGIKKVSGSSKGMLVRQFLSESIILSILSLILAIIIVEAALPYFNNLLGVNLQLNLFVNWFYIPALIFLSIFIGVLAGSYPAFYISSFNPYVVLKGKYRDSIKNGRFRSILVILQFSISLILIVGTTIMFRQIMFMLNKNLGFNKEQLLIINHIDAVGNHVKAFKDKIAEIPDIVKVAASSCVPGNSNSGNTYYKEGKPGEIFDFKINYIDYDFFETYGITLSSGRNFDKSFVSDKDAGIVNEISLKRLNIDNPLTTKLISETDKPMIIGVVKDFNYEPLRTQIEPYIFKIGNNDGNWGYVSIRLSKNASSKTIKEIEKVWKQFTSNYPFQYYFMDQDFELKYKEEKQNAQLSVIFSVIAIMIATIGLFGLTSFTIQQRTKEIGLRKTMGASVANILYMISKEFIVLISIATIIAWPIIYFIAKNWLQNYYYRINISPIDFLMSFLIVVIIAMATISYRIVSSARKNPVEALRYE